MRRVLETVARQKFELYPDISPVAKLEITKLKTVRSNLRVIPSLCDTHFL